RPYKTSERKLEGAVISFEDVDGLKRTLEQVRVLADSIIQNAREAILILDEDLNVAIANGAFYRIFRVTPEETLGRPIFDLGTRQWNLPKLRDLLEQVNSQDKQFDDFEVQQ